MQTEHNSGHSEAHHKKRRRRWIILLSIVGVLVLFRLFLPYIVLKYVNKKLSELKEYTGHVEDINIALIRGAYVIKGIELEKIGNEQGSSDTIPFFKSSTLDLSVEWKSLFKGAVVGEIYVEDPVLNFVKGKHKNEDVKADTSDFRQLIKNLMPLTVNHFEINNGQIHYIDQYAAPRIDVAMTDIHAEAFNLSNVNDSAKVLPAALNCNGNVYGGTFDLRVKFDALNKVPTFDLTAELKDLNITKLNNFFKAYGNFETEGGKFGLYTEFAAKEGRFGGYVKPIIKDIKVKQGEGNLKEQIWEAVVGAASKVLENPNKDQVATKLDINGRFDKPDINLWRAISYVLRNAFVQALKPTVDNSININKLEDEPEKKTLLERLFGKKKDDNKDKKGGDDEGKDKKPAKDKKEK